MVIIIIVNRPQKISVNTFSRGTIQLEPYWPIAVVGSNERMCGTGVVGPVAQAREIAAPRLSEPVVCANLCPVDLTLGCLKWAAVGFVVAFALLKLFEASHLHDDIPKPAFKLRQTKRATLVLSTFAAMLSALVWLLVQKLD